jgi:hypothetical protein
MSIRQLIELLWLTGLAVVCPPSISSVLIRDLITCVIDVIRQSNQLHRNSRIILFLPNLVSLLDMYSEPPSSIPLLYSVLPFRASSYVNAMSYMQLTYSRVVRAHLRHQAYAVVLYRLDVSVNSKHLLLCAPVPNHR